MGNKKVFKRIAMYLLVLVSIAFIIVIAYFFGKSEVVYALTIEEGSTKYLNLKDSMSLPLLAENADREEFPEVKTSDENVVGYSSSTKTLIARAGGRATITITPVNKNFGPFQFDIRVGDGTTENPYFVTSATSLASIGTGLPLAEGREPWKVTDSFELINDINLNSLYTTSSSSWTPIENYSGNFNGEGFKISNLRILTGGTNIGFFGSVLKTGKIENIIFENVIINVPIASNIGTVVGVNNGLVGRISVKGTINYIGEANVGGIVGQNILDGNRPILNMCGFEGNINAGGTIGGLVGHNKGGIIFNSYVKFADFSLADPAEPFIDENDNDTFDLGEEYTDVNENGLYDKGETYEDLNENGIFDTGDTFTDTNGNSTYDSGFSYILGGIAGINEGIYYNFPDEHDYRQAIIKNTYVLYSDYISIAEDTHINFGLIVAHNFERIDIYSFYDNAYVSNYACKGSLMTSEIPLIFETREGDNTTYLPNDLLWSDYETETLAFEEEQVALIVFENILEMETFEDWNFDSIWVSDYNIPPQLSISASYENVGIFDPGAILSDAESVTALLKLLSENTSNVLNQNEDPDDDIVINTTFYIEVPEGIPNKTITVDCRSVKGHSWEETCATSCPNPAEHIWTPISHFSGSLIVKKGTTLILENITILPTPHAGFFRTLNNANSTIQNIHFKNVTIGTDTAGGTIAGAIVGNLQNGVIEDCKVENVTIKNYIEAGFIAGTIVSSTSKVINCNVNGETTNKIINKIHDGSIYYGGIAGTLTSGAIKGTGASFTFVENAKLESEIANSSSSIENITYHSFGGIVGLMNSGEITRTYSQTDLKTVGNVVYAGGIVGLMVSGSISLSFAANYNADVPYQADGDIITYAGGIAGITRAGCSITKSFVEGDVGPVNITAKYVGGLVASNYGTIEECYALGTYKGQELGGLTYYNYGTVRHCFTRANLQSVSTSNKAVVAGLTAYLPEGGLIQFCYTAAIVTTITPGGNAIKWADTSSYYSYDWWDKLFTGNALNNYGTLINCILTNYEGLNYQGSSIGLDNTPTVINCQVTEIGNSFDLAGIPTNLIWDISAEYPSLIRCVVAPAVEEEE